MGWNLACTAFAAALIRADDTGGFDKAARAASMAQYRGTDVDSGGSRDLLASDSEDVRQIVIDTWGLDMPAQPVHSHGGHPDAWDDSAEALDRQARIVTAHVGWR